MDVHNFQAKHQHFSALSTHSCVSIPGQEVEELLGHVICRKICADCSTPTGPWVIGSWPEILSSADGKIVFPTGKEEESEIICSPSDIIPHARIMVSAAVVNPMDEKII